MLLPVIVGVSQDYFGTLEVWTFLGVLVILKSFYI